MKREDCEDMAQYVKLKKLTGRKATRRQLEIDFMRELFGDNRRENSRDAFKHRSIFEYDSEDKTENKLEKFLDMTDDLTLAQKLIAILIFCGFTLEEIKRITGLKYQQEVYRLLRKDHVSDSKNNRHKRKRN